MSGCRCQVRGSVNERGDQGVEMSEMSEAPQTMRPRSEANAAKRPVRSKTKKECVSSKLNVNVR
jgi:hypothetical protein